MTDAPEKVFVFPCMGCTMLAADTEGQSGSVEYIRAEAAEARVEELEARLAAVPASDMEATDRIEELQARVEELEAVLERIAAPCAVSAALNWRVMYEGWRALCVERVDMAREVLGEKEAPGQDVD